MTNAKDVKKGQAVFKVFEVNKVEDVSTPEEMALNFTITTDARDRDHDIVDPSGILVDNYSTNPVMLWAHDYTSLPVARSVSMWSGKSLKENGKEINGVKARVVFQPDENYHESYSGIRGSMVYRMYASGFLHAVSIGFNPLSWEKIEEKDEEKSGKTPTEFVDLMPNTGTKFLSWELLEFSAVPVPANPQALVDRGTISTRGWSDWPDSYKKTIKQWAQDTLVKCTTGLCPKETRVWDWDKIRSFDDWENKTFAELIEEANKAEEPVLKPYPNEHACRLIDPGKFEEGSFKRSTPGSRRQEILHNHGQTQGRDVND